MTSAGRYGWFTDRKGYRYVDRHPSGAPWPPIPASVLAVWRALVSTSAMPDCCLVNYYAANGAHGAAPRRRRGRLLLAGAVDQPRRSGASSAWAAPARKDPTASVVLESGDVVVFGGPARLAYHGIDRIRSGGSRLLPEGGRINLTLRVVD